ncbi:mRNA-capping enzyme-like [Aphidius gifuensis]|uniref:mRNA-capping enzyme-like n=1 Tax=Aphidius gifuensis TaxID=684658 RepID=UPI001CDCDAA0|nr:mRNA-capping enzyme-like [Aphidius gifuensis]
MSNGKLRKGPIPDRWLNCPRRAGRLINKKFLAFKTPLSKYFNDQVPEECRFSVDFLFNIAKGNKWKLGLWIDLTNTSRFYDRKDIESHGCKYVKLQCRGHGETPDAKTTLEFVSVCKQFISHHPLEIIGVHCTHGFNRTGFLLISYLIEAEENSLGAAMTKFAIARPPGIYKKDYIEELYKRYEESETPPPPPTKPDWCFQY